MSGTTTTTLSPEQVAALSDEDQIRYVLNAYWPEWLAAGNPPDPSRSTLLELLTGDALKVEKDELQKKVVDGRARRLPDQTRFAHSVVRIVPQGDLATVYECVVNDVILFESASGKIVNNELSTYLFQDIMTKESGRWQLKNVDITDKRPGEQPCANP